MIYEGTGLAMDKRIGAQFYTTRDYMNTIEDFDKSCEKISKIGYKIVQISGVPLNAKEIRSVLDKYGLKAVTSHRSFDDFKKNLDEIIEYNKTIGSDLCGIGMMPSQYMTDNSTLSEFIGEVNKMCETLKTENMYFGYHNHAVEFAQLDGKLIFDRLIEETNPEIFNFIADTYWFQVGGKTPQQIIRLLGKRAMAVHFKDFGVNIENWQVPQITEVGNGNLDWDSIIAACDEAESRWALVEQDCNWIDNDPFKALEMSYKFLSRKGFC